MAIIRCLSCGRPTHNVKPPSYVVTPFEPPNHPDSGLICGKPNCENPGLIWLKANEADEYTSGTRIFQIPTQAAKIRAA